MVVLLPKYVLFPASRYFPSKSLEGVGRVAFDLHKRWNRERIGKAVSWGRIPVPFACRISCEPASPNPNLWARTKYSDSVCIQSSMPNHKLSNLEPTHKANVLQPARSTSNHILHV